LIILEKIMWNILVSWSTAYDYIMDYKDKFQNHIKAENIPKLSVSFLIDELKKERWGTWLNIAYNIWLLWNRAILLSGVWKDFEFDDFLKENINLNYIYRSKDLFSSGWYITNDIAWNQITAFYPWAMNESDKVCVKWIDEKISYAIVSPNKKETMLMHMKELKNLWIRTFFDPGQAIFTMNKQDLLESMHYSDYLIVNDYEFNLFKDISWLEKEEIIKSFEKVIITMWDKWSVIIDDSSEEYIPPVINHKVVDPTWAWDAYRAWLLRWLDLWYNWLTSANIWTLLASYSVWSYGAQNHFIEKKYFQKWFEEEFGTEINLDLWREHEVLLLEK